MVHHPLRSYLRPPQGNSSNPRVPTYAGRYDGEFFVTACIDNPGRPGYCQGNVWQVSEGLADRSA